MAHSQEENFSNPSANGTNDPESRERDASANSGSDVNGIENRATPKSRHGPASTTSSQRDLSSVDDPNEGRCLLTDRPNPVQMCHLVSEAAGDEVLTKLEYVWEVGYRLLDVDAKRNVIHLRLDWLVLFDELQWILIPETRVLQELGKIYLEDKQPTHNLAKLYARQTFRYHVLPAPTLKEPICRHHGVQHHDDLGCHVPPYTTLGPLTTHVQPHFVIFNSGQKLLQFRDRDVARMTDFLSLTSSFSADDAALAIRSIQGLYRTWTEAQVPDEFLNEGPGALANQNDA